MMLAILFAAADSPFAWDFLGQWGPALPMFLAMVWFTDRLFRRFVEKGFREIHDLLKEQARREEERHKEKIALLEEAFEDLKQKVNNGRNL